MILRGQNQTPLLLIYFLQNLYSNLLVIVIIFSDVVTILVFSTTTLTQLSFFNGPGAIIFTLPLTTKQKRLRDEPLGFW